MRLLSKIITTLFFCAFFAPVLFLSTACPDPCLMGGKGCNSDDDCPANKHCIVPRDDDSVGCFFVKGTCEPLTVCRHQQDCSEQECCDEYTNLCAPAGACAQKCSLFNSDCPRGQRCDDKSLRCRPRCDVTNGDVDCLTGEMCDLGGYCSIPQGTPCGQRADAIVGECGFYVNCIAPNDDGLSYCSWSCSENSDCPAPTRCNLDGQCVSL